MYSLLPYNTFGIDVSAARFLEYTSVEELKKLIVQGAVTTPFLHIGGGSNLCSLLCRAWMVWSGEPVADSR